jgi:hypothetical protein
MRYDHSRIACALRSWSDRYAPPASLSEAEMTRTFINSNTSAKARVVVRRLKLSRRDVASWRPIGCAARIALSGNDAARTSCEAARWPGAKIVYEVVVFAQVRLFHMI